MTKKSEGSVVYPSYQGQDGKSVAVRHPVSSTADM